MERNCRKMVFQEGVADGLPPRRRRAPKTTTLADGLSIWLRESLGDGCVKKPSPTGPHPVADGLSSPLLRFA
ncbi:hypothetical protein Hdeb2414_s1162g00987181 [Helianthus debilis subsp. tardiflorus]